MKVVLCSAAALALAACLTFPLCGSAPADFGSEYMIHAPIRIDSDADFTQAKGVTGGSGTAADPWRLEGWNITGALQAHCIYVGNTTQPFAIAGCRAHNASGTFVSYYYTESGIIFYNVTNGCVSDAVVENNEFDGICLYNSTHCTLSGNNVRGNEYGITVMEGSNNNSVMGNTVQSNGYYGLSLIDASTNRVSANAVRWNGANGICISNGTFNRLDANNVTGNDNGIDLWEAGNNNVAGNWLWNNTNGIYLEYSDRNWIENNNASGNSECGIRLASSTGNRMFHNSLANNSVAQAMDASGGNAWDNGYPSGGNFWGEFVQQDANLDGFGDAPYLSIKGNMGSRDRYPLMRAWFPDAERPVAEAGADMAVDENNAVTFNGTASHDNVGIVNYSWQFSEKQSVVTLYRPLTEYNFAEPGTYSVTLNVTDSAGNTGSDWLLVDVRDVTAPIADAGPDRNASVGERVIFNGSGSADNVGIVNYTWNMDDGLENIALWGVTQAHEFRTAGTWTAILTVRDSAGLEGTDSMLVTVTVDAEPPVADAGNDRLANPGDLIKFNGTGSADNVGIVNYTWYFTYNGSAVFLYGSEPGFTFWMPGNYTVTLTVLDAAGNTDTDSVLVCISEPEVEQDNVSESTSASGLWLFGLATIIFVVGLAVFACTKRT